MQQVQPASPNQHQGRTHARRCAAVPLYVASQAQALSMETLPWHNAHEFPGSCFNVHTPCCCCSSAGGLHTFTGARWALVLETLAPRVCIQQVDKKVSTWLWPTVAWTRGLHVDASVCTYATVVARGSRASVVFQVSLVHLLLLTHWQAGWPDPGCWHGDEQYGNNWCSFG